jgi:DNA-binding NarL/FixJ family response regulator
VLLDLELGEIDGVEALRQVREIAPSLKVIVYTSHDEEDYIIQAAELGVDGYLLKGSPKEEIVGAVSAKDRQPVIAFSKREKQVLELLAGGKTNRDIGAALFISESTVKFHVHAILSKLDATNRTEAVSMAVRQGIISLPSAG